MINPTNTGIAVNTIIKPRAATLPIKTAATNTVDYEIADTTLTISYMTDYTPEAPFGCWTTNPYLAGEDDNDAVEISNLSDDDRKDLAQAEKSLVEFWDALELVLMDLHHIKEFKLFRETHPTFAAYCKDKLDLVHIEERNAAIMHLDQGALINRGLNDDEIAELNKETRILVEQKIAEKRKMKLSAPRPEQPTQEVKA
jgi:hypothetical protein